MNNKNTVSQLGFTIVELMISLFVGAIILAGVMFTFVGMKATSSDTMQIGELQESGRLAMDVLKRDLELTGFWGSFVATPHKSVLTHTSPTSPQNDCYGDNNNHSFPQSNASGERAFKVLFAKEALSNTELNCISNPKSGSDIIQIKHVVGEELADDAITDTDKHYFVSTPQTARFLKGTGAAISPPTNGSIWEYSHNTYFVADQNYTLNGKNVDIPTLKRMRLIGNKMTSETIMEGVENIRFIFGLDTDGDTRVDTYKPASLMHNSDWDQQAASVISVQIFLLLRTLEPDTANPPSSQTFILGGEGDHMRSITTNDSYRRRLITSTVRLANIGSDKWAI